ncbi:MAG: ABC transporter ATP-binding protein [Methylococcales bacterium]|jgi:putative ABC transport system ATP-binding protein|nr:ABC transporter ATP-binding protein [Methylococcales bacterium]MBT7408937.1 ABC transporter ATP-binding protein [Methylococcales bacterium]
MLQLNKISKSFSLHTKKIPVLSSLSLSVKKGESVAITGPSGSGKSTLLALLAGLDIADEGSIKVADQAIDKMSEKQLTQWRSNYLGIIFQQFHLISHLTALENIILPCQISGSAVDLETARQLLTRVGLSQRADHYPSQLSGGEKQRVAIARAIINNPPLLLADEPSGNLDIQTGDQVMQLVFDLVKEHQMTLVLVTHNPSLATLCDRQLLLKNGCFE